MKTFGFWCEPWAKHIGADEIAETVRTVMRSADKASARPFAAKAQTLTQLVRLKEFVPLPAQNGTVIDRLSKVVSEKLAEMDRTIALKADLQDSQATAVFRSNRGKPSSP